MDQSGWIINLAEFSAENDAIAVVFARTAEGGVEPITCIPKDSAGSVPENVSEAFEQGRQAFIREAEARGLWPLPLLPPA